jgi:hypothetical protein
MPSANAASGIFDGWVNDMMGAERPPHALRIATIRGIVLKKPDISGDFKAQRTAPASCWCMPRSCG